MYYQTAHITIQSEVKANIADTNMSRLVWNSEE